MITTGFKLNNVEAKRASEFITKHKNCKPKIYNKLTKLVIKLCNIKYDSPKLGYHFEFYPTGIGVGTYVVCDSCGDKIDITDYKAW